MSADVSEANRSFWDELCGTQLAQSIGVTDSSPESLKRFDDWYFDFYPYLEEEIPFTEVHGAQVLEVGLGYGTVSGRLMAMGAEFTGLDIAAGPVEMVRHRALQLAASGTGVQGSILDAPFPDESFDLVVAIGSFHHTGNTAKAIDETFRVLRPGGRAVVMVYNAYSYRRWATCAGETARHFFADKFALGRETSGDERARAQYDINSKGDAAPHTDFWSVSSMRRLTRNWTSLQYRRRNIGAEGILARVPRRRSMALLGSSLGLDIYFRLRK